MCSQPLNKSQKSHNTPESNPKIMLHFTKCQKLLHIPGINIWSYGIGLANFKKWQFCLWGVFTQAWRNHLLQFSHKLQLTSVVIRIPNHISSMFLVLKLSQFVLGGSYFFCCVYISVCLSTYLSVHLLIYLYLLTLFCLFISFTILFAMFYFIHLLNCLYSIIIDLYA